MLEDESGRIRLVGDRLKTDVLMTGIIVGALGMENPNGDFEVVDLCFADVCPNENTQATFEMEPRGMLV
jgi:DNA polymerase delta subunit 2